MSQTQANQMGSLLGIAIAVLFMASSDSHAAKPTFPTEPPPETVCYCHNVNHNPHTICTADRALQMGHTNHVNNGIDTLGECGPSTEPGCGDGRRNRGEQCDDGNTVTEGCEYGQTSCTVCAADCTEQPGETSYCGDGVTDSTNGEQCDGGDGCDENCKNIETSVCGDGELEGDEQCDCTDQKPICSSDEGNAVMSDACLKAGATVCDQCQCVR